LLLFNIIKLIKFKNLEYNFANKIVKYCNIISRFFKTSHRAGSILKQFVKDFNIEGGGLHIYTPTRWTSMFDTTEAISRLKRPLEKV
jgi:hypothetical protein